MKDEVIITMTMHIDKDMWEECLFDKDKAELLERLTAEKARAEITALRFHDAMVRVYDAMKELKED